MWNPADTFTDKCIDLKAYYDGIAGSNMALDVIILIMPLRMIWKLEISRVKKFVTLGIMMLGGL